MLLGPVFRSELLRTARRRRYYTLRVLYGLLLLSVVWLGYELAFAGKPTATIDEAAEFAEGTFIRFAVVQLVAILLMIPALFGGAIADEKQRKTLHYLMASQLSSFEIVVDKVLGRAPHVATFLALGLPMVCLLGLVGGVSPEYVAIAYLGTFTTATMAVALTVLVSTVSRKVRQAVLISYILLLAWQIAPAIVLLAGSRLFPATYGWIEPVNTWVGATSPLWVYSSMFIRNAFGFGRGMGPASATFLAEQLAWMAGLQLGAAALMVLLAVWQLRPTFRRHEATQPRRTWFGPRGPRRPGRRPRWWDRPACGDDAVLWKERYFARTDVFTKLVVLPATILVSTILIMASGLDESLGEAARNLWRGGGPRMGSETFVDHLRVVSAWYTAIWLLALAGASASCLTVEREEDTWISLTSTPLTGREIIRGKVLGAAWAQRGFLAIPLLLWAIGLVSGALHPLAVAGSLAMLGLTSWMVAAVGVDASLRAPSTSRALASTIGTLAVLYGYPLIFLRPFLGLGVGDRYATAVGFPPRLVVGPLASYGQLRQLWRIATIDRPDHLPWLGDLILGGGLAAIYLLVAALLTYRTVARFDRRLDRPSLLRAAEVAPSAARPVAAAPSLQS